MNHDEVWNAAIEAAAASCDKKAKELAQKALKYRADHKDFDAFHANNASSLFDGRASIIRGLKRAVAS